MKNALRLALAALLAVASLIALVPATASAAPGTSTVYVTHGLPLDNKGTVVDVYAGPAGGNPAAASLLIDNFAFGQTVGPVQLAAATYTVYLAAPTASDHGPLTASEIVYQQDLGVPAGQNLSVVASFTAAGAPNLAVFTNDVTHTGRFTGRVSIRHAAAAPAVNVKLGLYPFDRIFPWLFTKTVGPAANGQQADLKTFAGRYDVTVDVATSGATVATVNKLKVKSNTLTNVYAVGTPGQNFQFIVQTIKL